MVSCLSVLWIIPDSIGVLLRMLLQRYIRNILYSFSAMPQFLLLVIGILIHLKMGLIHSATKLSFSFFLYTKPAPILERQSFLRCAFLTFF